MTQVSHDHLTVLDLPFSVANVTDLDSSMAGALPPLAPLAFADLQDLFKTRGRHRPNTQQWAAIRDLLDHLDHAAAGELDRALYVSTIPPGTGKSQTIAAYARSLLNSADHRDVGMLILVNRKTEAQDMANAIGLEAYADQLCIIAADQAIRELAEHQDANNARVCIATQASLKRTLRSTQGSPSSFSAARRFHFQGRRRAIVCWDESFAFNRPVTLDSDAVLRLTAQLRRQSAASADALKRWSCSLDHDAREGRAAEVPDFRDLGVDFDRLVEDVAEDDQPLALALGIMSGSKAFAAKGDFGSATIVTQVPELPSSLLPVVITDASAKVNESYKQMCENVVIHWLASADKTYRNMTIRVVPTAASRSVFRDRTTARAKALIDMAVTYVRSTSPHDKVLIISYKGKFSMKGVTETSIENAILARMTDQEKARVHYLHWGAHTATNDYSDVRKVLLLGLHFLPRPAGHAAAGAALDLNLVDEHPTEKQINETRLGLLKDATLQAVLRGHARVGVDGDCGEMEVVIPMTKQTGLSRDDLLSLFPGAEVVDDHTLMPRKELRGRLRDLATVVEQRLAAGETEMTDQSLYKALGVDRRNFSVLVRRPAWLAHSEALGLEHVRLKGNQRGLRVTRDAPPLSMS